MYLDRAETIETFQCIVEEWILTYLRTFRIHTTQKRNVNVGTKSEGFTYCQIGKFFR